MQRIERMLAAVAAGALSLAVAGSAGAQPECQATLGDYVYEDVNENGIQDGPDLGIDGVSVLLFDEFDALLATTLTVGGEYSFMDLCAGTYVVDVDDATIPAGYVPTIDGAGGNPEQDSSTAPIVVVLPGDATIETGVDFGYVSTESGCTGFIGNYVFEDVNANGVQDGPDGSVAGVRILLTDSDGNTFESISTGDTGYGFSGLCAGDYTVEVDGSSVPADLIPTVSNVGDDSMDSDGSPVFVTLASDSTVDMDVDFGFTLRTDECGLSMSAQAIPEVTGRRGLIDWLLCHGDHFVTYRYDLENSGPDLKNVAILDDDRGWVGYLWRLLEGETKTRWSFACVGETTVSQLTANASFVESGETCSASATATVTVP